MRILHVTSNLDRRVGGPPIALAGLAIAQKRLGATVAVATTFVHGADHSLSVNLRRAGIDVSPIGPARGKLLSHPRIAEILDPSIASADVIHIHALWESIQHVAAASARTHKKPYVIAPHGMLDPWSLSQSPMVKRAFLALRVRRDLNGASFLHALNAVEASLIAPLKLESPCEIIPNGVDESDLTPYAGPSIRETFPQLGDAPFALFLSRLHPKKGLDVLADAFAIVAREHPTVKLLVAGPADGAERDFDARIAAAGLQDRVFRVGPIYGDDKRAALRDAKLFVLPSRQEGFSVAIVESLASGTPAVVSEACHFPEIAAANAGRVVPLDAKATAAAMLDLLRDEPARLAAGQAARALAARYTWDRIAAGTLQLYGRPSLAIFANSLTPYRVALHRRIARELPGVRLFSLFSERESNAPWKIDPPKEIGPVDFSSIADDRRRGGEIIAWLARIRPRAVIVNGYNGIDRLRVLRWCKTHSIPCYLWGDSNIRGDTVRGGKAVAKSLIVRWAIRQSAGVLTCGSLGQAYFEQYGASADQIAWMPYEPDYELVQNTPPDAIAAMRARFGLPADRRRLVYCGRLIDIKRVDLLLAAFTMLAADRPAWDCVIVGDGSLRAALQAGLPPSLTGRVIWTGFLPSPADVAAVLHTCDALVHVPDIEPWALVINEAVAAGLAIVATDVVGAAAELVSDGVNGRIVPAGDHDALLAALRDVTDLKHIERYKAASAGLLTAWREQADPVSAVKTLLGDSN